MSKENLRIGTSESVLASTSMPLNPNGPTGKCILTSPKNSGQ